MPVYNVLQHAENDGNGLDGLLIGVDPCTAGLLVMNSIYVSSLADSTTSAG